jgi:hypothetical protein
MKTDPQICHRKDIHCIHIHGWNERRWCLPCARDLEELYARQFPHVEQDFPLTHDQEREFREVFAVQAHNVTVVDHVKLFRNRPELRFDGRMHEQILGAIRRVGGEIGWTDLNVVHSGSDQSPAAQARKLERDLRLLMLELVERPEHPFTLLLAGAG